MKKYTVYIILIGLASFFHSCSKDGVAKYVLVPQPQEAVFNEEEYFTLNDNTTLAYSDGDSHLMNNALTCLSEVEQITCITLRRASDSSTDKNCISLKTDSDIKPEGYRMTVSKEKVEISAADSVGFFYGMQTIKHAVMLQQSTGNYQLMGGYISDAPAMPYRGAMLDVSRNFFDVAQVKRFIDMLAMHKLNYFHWHLTDDQGWRIEIKKYPALTSTGAWRTVRDKRSGGYYTQTQISEIIAYAAQRCITVIPEIDLPGHTSAALAAYPMLGCTGGPYQVATESGGVHKDVICLGKESSYQFIHDVMAEVAALFPAPYIHIGGDEVPRDRWKGCAHCQRAISKRQLKGNRHFSPEDLLQGDFNKHIATYLRTLGKRMIAWDEVIADNIDKETIIMSWRGLNKGVDAIKRGHHAIFSSNGDFYLNNYQTTDMNKAPKATGGFLPMQKVYHTALTNLPLSVQEQQLMMGAEAVYGPLMCRMKLPCST